MSDTEEMSPDLPLDLLDRTLNDEEIDDLIEADEVPTTVTYSTQDYPVDGLVKRLSKGSMRVPAFAEDNPGQETAGFQRGFVWTKGQMDRFIESLLLGYPVPGIFLVKQTDNVLLVLDGQQRLETLRRFYDGLHNDRAFALENVSSEFRGRTYKTLDDSMKLGLDDSFMQATIVATDGSRAVNDAIYKIFERLNSGGTQLTAHEIRVALYAGPLMVLTEKLNSEESWRDLFGPKSKRIRDHELCMRVLAMYLRSDTYSRPLKTFLNDFSAEFRDASSLPGTAEQLFVSAAKVLAEEVGSHAFRRTSVGQVNVAQAEAVMVGLMRAMASGTKVVDVSERVDRLRRDDNFARATTRATADNDAVKDRLAIATRAFEA